MAGRKASLRLPRSTGNQKTMTRREICCVHDLQTRGDDEAESQERVELAHMQLCRLLEVDDVRRTLVLRLSQERRKMPRLLV